MTMSRRKFSAEFKLRAVRPVEAGASVAAVARRHEIHPTLLSKWRWRSRASKAVPLAMQAEDSRSTQAPARIFAAGSHQDGLQKGSFLHAVRGWR